LIVDASTLIQNSPTVQAVPETACSILSINWLLEHDVVAHLLEEEINLARERKLLSDDHFSADGTRSTPGRRRKAFQWYHSLNRP
jgi:hypothetical protein